MGVKNNVKFFYGYRSTAKEDIQLPSKFEDPDVDLTELFDAMEQLEKGTWFGNGCLT